MDYFKTNIIVALALTFKNKQVSTCKQCIWKTSNITNENQ